MRLGFIADVHAANHQRFGGAVESGINRRCSQILAALRAAAAKSREEGCAALFVLGDLFDSVRPEPQVIAAVQEALRAAPDPHVLVGNHDQVSTLAGDHAVGPLGPVAAVIEVPEVVTVSDAGQELSVVCMPFQPGPAIEWLPAALGNLDGAAGGQGRVLLLHLGIEDEATPGFLRGAHDSIPVAKLRELAQQHGFAAVFAGNWHKYRAFPGAGAKIVQVGALAPCGFRDSGWAEYGRLVVWDSAAETYTSYEIPGPRFFEVRNVSGFTSAEQAKAAGHSVYLRCVAGGEDIAGMQGGLAAAKEKGHAVAGSVEVDGADARAAARSSAAVAQSSTTLDEALAGYVEQMAIPEGVDRAAVLAMARKYLGG